MNNQLVMKESKVNPMHDSPFYSSLAFPISTIVEAIISSTADTVFVPITFVSQAQSIHAYYLSGLPGDPPWIVVWAWPLSIENVHIPFYVIKGRGVDEITKEQIMKRLEPYMISVHESKDKN